MTLMGEIGLCENFVNCYPVVAPAVQAGAILAQASSLKRHVARARCRRIWFCCDRTLVCVCEKDLLPFFVFSLRLQVMSQPRRSARLAARFQSARSLPSDDLVLSEVVIFLAPSCFVCDGHFTSSGPLSRCVLQCCPLSIHLQCVTDLVHLLSQSVVCPACNSQSLSSLDFLHFQHLLVLCSPRGGSCRREHDLCLSSDLCFFLQSFLLSSTHSLRTFGSVRPCLRGPLPFLHTGPRARPV